jgi:hypothetical protein
VIGKNGRKERNLSYEYFSIIVSLFLDLFIIANFTKTQLKTAVFIKLCLGCFVPGVLAVKSFLSYAKWVVETDC